jgi:hypothetical protein
MTIAIGTFPMPDDEFIMKIDQDTFIKFLCGLSSLAILRLKVDGATLWRAAPQNPIRGARQSRG